MAPRRKEFRSRKPFADDQDAGLALQKANGPVTFLNPTQGLFKHTPSTALPSGQQPAGVEAVLPTPDDTEAQKPETVPPIKHSPGIDGIHFIWRSRDNRKGRHSLRVQRPHPDSPFTGQLAAPRRSSHPKEVLKVIVKTFTYFPVWDISWLVAFIFTLGSVVWVINGFFAWLPLVRPSTTFPGEGDYGGGITAFIGAILFFETGSLLLILEAINANDTGCFGWAVEELVEEEEARHRHGLGLFADKALCRHHHQNKHNLVGRPQQALVPKTAAGRHWRWRISWHDLTHHYIYELGFLAGAAQLFGATVFGVAGFTALPGILNHLTPQWRLNAAYWIPQVVGGSGFIMSGLLYMLETQDKWWKPAPRLLGWHIAFWNLIGAFGFTLCGALGMAYGNSGAQYQASLATFWYVFSLSFCSFSFCLARFLFLSPNANIG